MEERFPWNFLQNADIADVALQLWLLKDLSKGRTSKNFAYSYLQGIDMFACAYFDVSERIGNFCIACFFDKEDTTVLFLKSDAIRDLMEAACKKIKEGQDPMLVLQDLYKSLLSVLRRHRIEAPPPSEDIFSLFSDIFASLRALLRKVKKITDISVRREIVGSIKDLTMYLIELSVKYGGKEVLSELVQNLLEELSGSGEKAQLYSERKYF